MKVDGAEFRWHLQHVGDDIDCPALKANDGEGEGLFAQCLDAEKAACAFRDKVGTGVIVAAYGKRHPRGGRRLQYLGDIGVPVGRIRTPRG